MLESPHPSADEPAKEESLLSEVLESLFPQMVEVVALK